MKIKELLSDASKWTQGATARGADGKWLLDAHMSGAVSYCLVGAINHCYPPKKSGDTWAEYYAVRQRIMSHLNISCVTEWNDAADRTFEEVKELVELLDI